MQELEEQKQHLAADMLEAAGHIVLLPRVIGPAQKRLRKAFVSWFTESWLPSAKPFVLHKILLPLSPALKANSGNDELWVSFDSLWAALAMDNMLLPAKVVDDYDVLQPLLRERHMAVDALPKEDYVGAGCVVDETEHGVVLLSSREFALERALHVVVSSMEPDLENEWRDSQQMTFTSRADDEAFEQDLLRHVASVKAEEFDNDQLLRAITQLKHKQKHGRRRRINKLWHKATLYEKRERYRPVAIVLSRLIEHIDGLRLVSELGHGGWRQAMHYFSRCLLGRGQLAAANAGGTGRTMSILAKTSDTAVSILCENVVSYTVDMLVEQVGPSRTKAAMVSFLLMLLVDEGALGGELLDVFVDITGAEDMSAQPGCNGAAAAAARGSNASGGGGGGGGHVAGPDADPFSVTTVGYDSPSATGLSTSLNTSIGNGSFFSQQQQQQQQQQSPSFQPQQPQPARWESRTGPMSPGRQGRRSRLNSISIAFNASEMTPAAAAAPAGRDPPTWLAGRVDWEDVVRLSSVDGFEQLSDSLFSQEGAWQVYLEQVPSLLEMQPHERDGFEEDEDGNLKSPGLSAFGIGFGFGGKASASRSRRSTGASSTAEAASVGSSSSDSSGGGGGGGGGQQGDDDNDGSTNAFSERLFRRLLVCLVLCPGMYTELVWQFVVLHLGSAVVPKGQAGVASLIQGHFDGFCPPSTYHRRVLLLRYNPRHDLPTHLHEVVQRTKLNRTAAIVAGRDIDELRDAFTGITSATWVVVMCSDIGFLKPLHWFLMEQAQAKRSEDHALPNVIVLCPVQGRHAEAVFGSSGPRSLGFGWSTSDVDKGMTTGPRQQQQQQQQLFGLPGTGGGLQPASAAVGAMSRSSNTAAGGGGSGGVGGGVGVARRQQPQSAISAGEDGRGSGEGVEKTKSKQAAVGGVTAAVTAAADTGRVRAQEEKGEAAEEAEGEKMHQSSRPTAAEQYLLRKSLHPGMRAGGGNLPALIEEGPSGQSESEDEAAWDGDSGGDKSGSASTLQRSEAFDFHEHSYSGSDDDNDDNVFGAAGALTPPPADEHELWASVGPMLQHGRSHSAVEDAYHQARAHSGHVSLTESLASGGTLGVGRGRWSTSSPGLNEQWVRDQEEVARQADARSFEAASPDAQEMEQQEQVEEEGEEREEREEEEKSREAAELRDILFKNGGVSQPSLRKRGVHGDRQAGSKAGGKAGGTAGKRLSRGSRPAPLDLGRVREDGDMSPGADDGHGDGALGVFAAPGPLVSVVVDRGAIEHDGVKELYGVEHCAEARGSNAGKERVSAEVTRSMEHYLVDTTQDFADALISPNEVACLLQFHRSKTSGKGPANSTE